MNYAWTVYDRKNLEQGTVEFSDVPYMEEVFAALVDKDMLLPTIEPDAVVITPTGDRRIHVLYQDEEVYTLKPMNHHMDVRVRLHLEVKENDFTPELRERFRRALEEAINEIHDEMMHTDPEGVTLTEWSVLEYE